MNKTLTILIGVLLGIIFTLSKGTAIMFGAIIVTGIALWSFLPKPDRKFLMALFITGISLRVILFAILYIVSISQGGCGEVVPDSRLYFLKTLDMIRTWTGQSQFVIQVEQAVGRSGYLYVLAFFYTLIGYNPTVLNPVSMFPDKLINCIIGTILGIPIFYISKNIFGKKVAKISSSLVVFYPSLVFWSMTNSRDSVNILLVSLIIYSLVQLYKEKRPIYFILLFISLLLLKTIRLYIFFSMLIVVGLSLFVIIGKNLKRKILTLVIFIILIALSLNLTESGRVVKDKFFNPNAVIKKLYIANHNIILEGGPLYKIYDDDFLAVGKPNGFKLIKVFLKGITYFMLVPFPWTISSVRQIITYPQIIIWYFILPFTLIGILLAIRYRLKISFSVICYTFLVTSLFALVEGNIGAVLRHRDLVLVFYFIFGSAGLVKTFDRKALFYSERSQKDRFD